MPSFELQPSRGKFKFRSYLGRVVGNAIERYRRRPHRRLEVLEEDEVLARAPGTGDSGLDAAWQREWEDHHLRRALEAVEGERVTASLTRRFDERVELHGVGVPEHYFDFIAGRVVDVPRP